MMSDTENKTENTEETKVDTAPYMKKTGQNKNKADSTGNNMIIPAALVMVSALVIGLTFYTDKDKTQPVQNDAPAIATTEVEATIEATEPETIVSENEAATAEQTASNTETVADEKTEASEQNITADITSESEAPVASKTVVISEEQVVVTTVVAPQATATNNMATTRAARTPYPYNPYNREQQAQSRAQAMAKHMAMLQQRRAAYEKEMQDRRAKYETAMKARQEKQSKVAEAKKAVFQRIQKDRLAAEQRIQEIHQQISKLHEEIHQIMRETRKNGAPVQMHSM